MFGAIVPAAAVGVPIQLLTLVRLMIQPAVQLKVAPGALPPAAEPVGARHLHHRALLMIKQVVQLPVVVGAPHNGAVAAGALPAPRKNARPIMKLTAQPKVKLGACHQAQPQLVAGALTVAPIPPLPKQTPKQLASIPIINGA